MNASISKYTLFEYLSGRCNPLEKQLTEEWIKKEENSEVFYEWLLEYETRSPQFIPNHELAIEELLQRIHINSSAEKVGTDPENNIQETAIPNPFRIFWLIAASILLLVSCGWWFRDPIQYKTYQTGYGQTTNLYLEDGSRVALNANSILKIPRFGFNSDVREVSLKGEGEFTVSHTIDNKRFVVKTSDTFQVEVLGTQFSVFARQRGTKVALKCGSVRIDYADDQHRKELMMEPGDLAILDKTGAVQLEKQQDPKMFAAWKEQRYVFNATSVIEITSMLEENFGKHINIEDRSIALRTITGNFKTKNADELLKTISEVLDLKIRTSGDSILLTNN